MSNELPQVAVIGLAGRFPGAGDVKTFWQQLSAGQEGLSFFSEPELREAGVPAAQLSRPGYVRAKGVLDGADTFDADFFGLSPREAGLIDPQHRVFLECAWEVLESAGHDPQTFDGRIGVFAGASLNTYLLRNLLSDPATVQAMGEYQTQLASDKDFLATRAAYKLGLTGPAITVQTACSTSLVAVHLACQSLLSGESDLVLAGGVSVNTPLRNGYQYESGGILSPDGHCRPFDAAAGGTVIGNGVALVALRRLSDALRDGDVIDAVIRGSAINNDGALKAGYTAPSVEGQATVIAEALGMAEVEPRDIGYVETHGTGTALGDPIEIAALTRAYRERTDARGYCAIGSVKGNVGHLDAAAGATGLIKTVMALRQEAIPPSLHFEQPNPELRLESSPFFVNATHRPWPRNGQPRRAGVSAFGIGGTNAHVVLEEGPEQPVRPAGRPWQLLTLSGRTDQAVAQAAGRLAEHLRAHPQDDLADVALTLSGRRAFPQRRALVCRDKADAVRQLQSQVAAARGAAAVADVPVAFLFPGQGTQYAGMARDLYPAHPGFAAELDHCLDLFAPHLDENLRRVLFPGPGQEKWAQERLQQTDLAQPALFSVEYALARTLIAAGVRPAALAGHSVGEYVAACLAGVFDLPDAVAVVAARGGLLKRCPAGAMLAVFRSEADVQERLEAGMSLAAVNGEELCVVSGSYEAVERLAEDLAATRIGHRRLHTSHAFHSRLVEEAVAPLREVIGRVRLKAPRIPFTSNVTGTWITTQQATDPAYWAGHLRSTVRFGDNLSALLADPQLALLEVGPGKVLSSFARRHPQGGPERTVTRTMRQPDEQGEALPVLLEGLGRLWEAGVRVEVAAWAGDDRRRVRLPGYPFQRRRYWVEPGPAPRPLGSGEVDQPDHDQWTYGPGWRRLAALPGWPAPVQNETWLLLGGTDGLSARLSATGAKVVQVRAGTGFASSADGCFTVDPSSVSDLSELLSVLDKDGATPRRVVHRWSLDASGSPESGLHSLMALGQVLARRPGSAALTLDVVTRGAFAVMGHEASQPQNAMLLGPCTVIPQEIPGVECRLVDLNGDSARDEPRELGELARLLAAPVTERVLAQRGRHWWARTFDPLPLAGTPVPRLRDNGLYLITGGTGGLGLEVAGYLATAARAPVIALLARTEIPGPDEGREEAAEGLVRRLEHLRELGAVPVTGQADITDPEQTRRVVRQLQARYGPVRGIIHAAGVPGGGLIAGRSRDDVEAVLAAKVRGTQALQQACAQECAQEPPDFLLLFSSRTALLGGPGQADYAAANAYLDAYAAQCDPTGGPWPGTSVTSIAWDTWQGIGMAASSGEAPSSGEIFGHPLLQRRLPSAPGTETFRATLRTSEHWVVDEHRMQGHGLVPGTTYLEMVRAAVAPTAGDREIQFRDVLFTQPVIVPDGQTRDVHTFLQHRPDGVIGFHVRSRVPGAGGTWQEHATGSVHLHEPRPPAAVDLRQLLPPGTVEVIEGEEQIRRRLRLDFAADGSIIRFDVQGRWRSLNRIEVVGQNLLAHLELPDRYAGDLATYQLHPALLDVVGGASRVYAAEGYYLPFWYGSLRFLRPMTARTTCHIRIAEGREAGGETLTCQADVYDQQGNLLVQLDNFIMKRIHDPHTVREQVERAARPVPAEETANALPGLAPGLTAAEGRQVLGRIFDAPALPPVVVVSRQDLTTARRVAESIDPARLFAELAAAAPVGDAHPRPDLNTPFQEPSGEAEIAVAAIWRETLGIEPVGAQDDFFELGGHSLAAVQIGTRIRARFGVDLALPEFFDRPTVAATAQLLSGADPSPAASDERIRAITREDVDVDALSDDEVEAMLQQMAEAVDGSEQA